jgi:hypothetical protein
MMLQLQEQYKDLSISRADDVYSGATDTYERYYKIGDYEAMPSVTTVLEMINKPALRDWKMNKALDYLGGKYAKRHWDDRIATPPWVRYPTSPKAQSFRTKVKTSWRDALASLRRNAKAHPNRVRDDAGDIGTEIHEAIAAEMRGEPWELVSEPAAIAMQSYRLWQEKVDECRVVHLDKSTPAWSEYKVKDWKRSFNGFLSALNTWKLWHDGVFTSNDS